MHSSWDHAPDGPQKNECKTPDAPSNADRADSCGVRGLKYLHCWLLIIRLGVGFTFGW